MSKKLFLLDALALIYRAYYALIRTPRITTTGINTNAQFGFTNTLLEIIKKENPTHIAVCFDTHAPTERHSDFTDYKANRQEAPEDLLDSLPHIKAIIEGFNIPVIEYDGYEADDIIGTLAWQAADKGYEVYMVTPDKDYGQLLVKPNVYIWKPPAFGNKEEIVDAKKICEKWDIARVEQVVDMLGLMGDASDNIPGIPGVGEKTAAKLLKLYDTLEGVLDNADKITGSMGEKVRAGKKSAIMSKKLATIITNVPVTFHEEDFKLKEKNKSALAEIFNELEFKTLGKRILGEDFSVSGGAGAIEVATAKKEQTDLFGNTVNVKIKNKKVVDKNNQTSLNNSLESEPNDESELEELSGEDLPVELVVNKNSANTTHSYRAIEGKENIQALVKELSAQKEICIDTETTGINANDVELVGLSFSYKEHEGFYVPIEKEAAAKKILGLFEPLFKNKDIVWIGQNLKYDFLVLKWYGVELLGKTFDTMLAHYVIEPEGRRSMDLLSAQFLGYEPISITTLIGKKGKNQGTMRDAPLEQVTEYAAEDADITFQLKNCFTPLIKKRGVEKVFNEVENPLVRVLVDMEYEGVKVDIDFLNEYSKVLETEARTSEERVYEQAGVRFNLASPKQLGEVLFDILKLDAKAKKTKTGQYATGEDVLQKMAAKHKIVDDILNFRELTKLKSTYVDSFPELINPKTGRVHTSYAQAVAVTGRLSSTNPNLQNIPIRTERGREIRKAFIPREKGRVLVSADYSQIELRIVAAISGDPNMCEAFKLGKDIHTATAAKVYGIKEAEVTKEMRYKAKSVNFGIIYGQGAFGLAENLAISRTEAKEIIDNYKKEFPGIQRYMDEQINNAKELGFVETLMGRRRWLRDINSSNFTVRGFAERNAINSPIQGSAADMIKLAMIKIHAEMKKTNWESKMILQVHDELVFDAVEKELPKLKELILRCMKEAMVLPNGVPVEAEVGVGKNWLEAH
ncbi:MAG: DNA polymerase I [Chitinophagia bacterium]|jgi:DNA polymerase-1|nr:DNA polymerase I [Chitinophagia bacterium]NCA29597.1 DNA polymerase I [Chitinophagia bacterium]NDD15757.1 DNA polymerase I [Chitinophagia bacterium]